MVEISFLESIAAISTFLAVVGSVCWWYSCNPQEQEASDLKMVSVRSGYLSVTLTMFGWLMLFYQSR